MSTPAAPTLTLAQQLEQAMADLTTARASITTLTTARDTATARVTALEGQVTVITGERDTARARVTELEGQVRTITTERDTLKANAKTTTERATEIAATVGVPPVVAETKPAGGNGEMTSEKARAEYARLSGEGKAREAGQFYLKHRALILGTV